MRRHYAENKQYYIDKAKRNRLVIVDEYRKLKEAPCTDCGVEYPFYVMQHDHVGTDKVANVSKLARLGYRKKMLEEIAKCELVCANCHAVRTWTRTKDNARLR